jgi:hypothetical protein
MLIVGVVLFALFVQGLGVAVLFKAASSRPYSQYNAAEQQFLADVHSAQPSSLDNQPWVAWDNDAALVYEGHALCIWQDSGSPLEAAGVMPPAVQHYPEWQAVRLENLANDNLCTRHKIVLR